MTSTHRCFLAAALLLLLTGDVTAQCPCWQAADGTVTCEDPSLTSIPSCVPTNIVALYLNFNLIPIIKDNLQRFNVQKLWIQNRDLDVVLEDAFIGNGDLLSLVISGTSLRYISPVVFYYTPRLQVLDLKNNKFTLIPRDAFVNLHNVKEIYLQNNALMTLTPSSFENTGVQWLFLESNPWICDCAIMDLLQWMGANGVRLGDNPSCVYPLQLRGVLLTSLSTNIQCGN